MTTRLAHVIPNLLLSSGGPARNVPRLCEALVDAGFAVELHAVGAAADAAPVASKVELRLAPASAPRRLGRSPALARAVSGSKAELIHAHALWMLPLGYAARAARRRNLPLVISPRGMLADWAIRRSPLKKLMAGLFLHPGALHGAAGWHATSTQEADEIRRRGFRQPICVAPNGVEPISVSEHAVRAAYAPHAPEIAGRRVLLFFSRFHSKKRVIELIADFAGLAPRHPEWRLLLAGIPEEYDVARLRAEAQLAGVADRVAVVDARALPPPYALADLFVLPTHNENFGRVVPEALICGVPVLTTTGTPWSELEQERAGRWVPIDGLASALDGLMSLEAGTRREMGACGQRFVRDRYGWPQVIRPLVEFYRQLGAHP